MFKNNGTNFTNYSNLPDAQRITDEAIIINIHMRMVQFSFDSILKKEYKNTTQVYCGRRTLVIQKKQMPETLYGIATVKFYIIAII